jgi:hypothetical protein
LARVRPCGKIPGDIVAIGDAGRPQQIRSETMEDVMSQFRQVVTRAWTDDAFKHKLMTDPAGSLRAEGIAVSAGVEVRVVEDTATVVHLVIPPKTADGELDMQSLERVAGGWYFPFRRR